MILRGIKQANVLLMTIPFALCWGCFYVKQASCNADTGENWLMIFLFVFLYCIFGRLYEAFQVSTKRISEMIYSQSLSAFMADGILLMVIWMLLGHFPSIWPAVICGGVQILVSASWSFFANHLSFRVFPPEPTAIISGTSCDLDDLERLIDKYGLNKKCDVQLIQNIDDCLQDLSVLDTMHIVFMSDMHSEERNMVLKYCVARGIHVILAPCIGDVLLSGAEQTHLFHSPMLHVNWYHATPEYLAIKRAMDVLLSLAALVVLSPVMLAVAIAVKAYDGGPVFYSQIRLTKDGRPFSIFKFRSMIVNAEADGVARLSMGEKDSRITPVGRVIRRFRLDELPQLVNVLKGDLSLVGPRPERPEIAAQYEAMIPEFALRLQVKAGLTGYAQVYGKYNTTPYDKLRMDLMYIAHPSILADLKIIMATVKVLFLPESTEGIEEKHMKFSAMES